MVPLMGGIDDLLESVEDIGSNVRLDEEEKDDYR